MMGVIFTTFATITVFTITTVTATVNEKVFQEIPHEAQLPKHNSSGFLQFCCTPFILNIYDTDGQCGAAHHIPAFIVL